MIKEKYSKRSEKILSQPMFDILKKAAEIEKNKKVIHFEIGDSSSFENTRMQTILAKYLNNPQSLGYSPSAGETCLREAFSFHYTNLTKNKIDVSSVVITPANAAITQIFQTILDVGDSVLLPNPGFPTYKIAANKLGLKVGFYNIKESDRFQLNVKHIIKILQTKRIKLIVINNPSNPIGIAHNRDDIDQIVSFCNKNNIFVLLDDTYRNLIYIDDYPRVSHQRNLIYLYSISKDTASPALRIGCIISNPLITKKIENDNSSFYSCLPKFIQIAVSEYLFEDHRKFRREMREELKNRIEYAHLRLKNIKSISYVKPDAGMYFYINIKKLGMTDKEFANTLLTNHCVAVCPGSSFGTSGKYYIRLCISIKKNEFIAGIKKLAKFIISCE